MDEQNLELDGQPSEIMMQDANAELQQQQLDHDQNVNARDPFTESQVLNPPSYHKADTIHQAERRQ
jgi:hypothetical protein